MAPSPVKKVGSLRLLYQVHVGYPFLLEKITCAVDAYVKVHGLKVVGPRTVFFHFDPATTEAAAWEARVGRTIVGLPGELEEFLLADYADLYCLEAPLVGGVDPIRRLHKVLVREATGGGLTPRDFWRLNYERKTVGGVFKQITTLQLFVQRSV